MTEMEVIRRLEKLERDNRRLKGFAFAGLALAAVLGAIYAAQPVPNVIRAHEFDAVDSSGTVRAKMGVMPSGPSAIGLSDGQGNPRMAMHVPPSSAPDISLSGAQGFGMDLGSASTETPVTGGRRQPSFQPASGHLGCNLPVQMTSCSLS